MAISSIIISIVGTFIGLFFIYSLLTNCTGCLANYTQVNKDIDIDVDEQN